jgi:hypothetical protein
MGVGSFSSCGLLSVEAWAWVFLLAFSLVFIGVSPSWAAWAWVFVERVLGEWVVVMVRFLGRVGASALASGSSGHPIDTSVPAASP